ncbi:TOMM precursor leader peptide-binding protein [Pseudonocardia xinjiangensis]|uniref:TOMM precursor leader peptide-binding protein n=1 Tax=Pseudonocardia xinjiangensis TaxID=75289 RepID=UPI003D8F37D2
MPTAARPSSPVMLRLSPHRSVLRLGPRARLLGLDPATAVAVDDLPPALAAMLDELDGPVGHAELVARAVHRGVEAAEADALVWELVAAGALVDATALDRATRNRATSTVVVTGCGPLSVGVVVGLAQAGVGAVHVETSGPVLSADLGTGFLDTDRGHDRLAATRAAVRRLCPGVTTGPPPQRLVPDLVVLADALAPEPERVTELHAGGTAHLSTRMRDGVGIVGPLVLPGRTACLGCLDLLRSAHDPGWPTVAAQLVGRAGRGDPAAVRATAALAAAQVLAALDATAGGGPPPPTLDTTIELDVVAGTLVRRTWSPQPGCGCGASSERVPPPRRTPPDSTRA